jgi:hypothetical protein
MLDSNRLSIVIFPNKGIQHKMAQLCHMSHETYSRRTCNEIAGSSCRVRRVFGNLLSHVEWGLYQEYMNTPATTPANRGLGQKERIRVLCEESRKDVTVF